MLGPNWLMKQNNDLKNSEKNLKKNLNQKDWKKEEVNVPRPQPKWNAVVGL